MLPVRGEGGRGWAFSSEQERQPQCPLEDPVGRLNPAGTGRRGSQSRQRGGLVGEALAQGRKWVKEQA